MLNNVIFNTGDDAIAMEGTFYLVALVDPVTPSLTVTTYPLSFNLNQGDTVTLYDSNLKTLGSVGCLHHS